MSDHERAHVDHCLNCGAATPGAYCPDCGQQAVNADVRFKHQADHFFEEVFTVESRLPQTLKTLLFQPGALTKAYNGGQRVRFITPLKIYLAASFTFFFVLSLAPAKSRATFVQTHGGGGDLQLTFNPGPNDKPLGVAELDAWTATDDGKHLPPFLTTHLRSMVASPAGFVSSLIDMASKASLALVPIYALVQRLLYWRSRRFYGEHFVFSLHTHAFVYLACSAASLVGMAGSGAVSSEVNLFLAGACAIYVVLAAKTASSEGLGVSALKVALGGVAYFFALIGVIVAVFLATFATD